MADDSRRFVVPTPLNRREQAQCGDVDATLQKFSEAGYELVNAHPLSTRTRGAVGDVWGYDLFFRLRQRNG